MGEDESKEREQELKWNLCVESKGWMGFYNLSSPSLKAYMGMSENTLPTIFFQKGGCPYFGGQG